MTINATTISMSREEMANAAKQMLAGNLSYIEGTRMICGLFEDSRVDRFAKPFVAFLGVRSETDIVPFGWLRENWHPETRVQHEMNWQKAEDWARHALDAACRDLIAWVRDNPTYGC